MKATSLETYLEFIAERLVVKKDPRVPILPVPMELELGHALHNAIQLGVAYQADECCSRL